MIPKHLFYSVLLAKATMFVSLSVQSQDNNEGLKSDLKRNINIQKETSVEIESARRSFDKMGAAENNNQLTVRDSISRYNFSLIHYPLNMIDPAVNVAERQVQKYYYPASSNYLKAGFGNYITSYLEGFVGTKPDSSYQVGLHIKHLSSQTGAVDKKNSASSYNEAEFLGRYFMQKGEISATIGYDRQMVKYYGYGKEAPRSIIDTFNVPKNIYQTVSTRIGYKSNEERGNPITYQVNIKFHRTADSFKAEENNLDLGGRLNFTMNKKQRISVGTNLIIANKSDSMQLNRNMFRLAPAYHLTDEMYELRLGLTLAYQAKVYETGVNPENYKNAFYVYPNLYAKVQILPNELSVFGSITGDLQQQTLRGLIAENPFLNRDIAMAHTHNQLNIQAGVQASPNNQLNLKGIMGYGIYKNMHFFMNNPADSAKFDVVYQNKNTGVFTVGGEVALDLASYKTTGKIEYFNYNLPQDSLITKAFHRPEYVVTWLNTFKVNDNINVGASLYLLGGILAPQYDYSTNRVNFRELSPITDLNIRGEYMISDNLYAFLNVNNLLARQYERYQNYQVRTINGLIGVALSF